eukprot:scaffold170769_cov28-Tisochrysis_lutea.AAC.9
MRANAVAPAELPLLPTVPLETAALPTEAERLRTTTICRFRPKDGATHRTSTFTAPPAGITPAFGWSVRAAKLGAGGRRREAGVFASKRAEAAVQLLTAKAPSEMAVVPLATPATHVPLPAQHVLLTLPPVVSLRALACASSFRSMTTNCTSDPPKLTIRKLRVGGPGALAPSALESCTRARPPISDKRTSPKSSSCGSRRKYEAGVRACRQISWIR